MAMIPRVYLDACALMRLYDRGNQARVRAESRATEEFLALAFRGLVVWIVSEVLEAELSRNPDFDTRLEALDLLTLASERLLVSDGAFRRAEALEQLGYGAFDALHLACAEEGKVDSLLTTDDRFMRQIRRGLGKPVIQVENPVKWRQGFKP
jgi:predicted nucleic acid-binding protein